MTAPHTPPGPVRTPPGDPAAGRAPEPSRRPVPPRAEPPAAGLRPRTGLVGYFGWGNFGDELMRQVWDDALGGDHDLRRVHAVLRRPYFRQSAAAVADSYDQLLIGGGDLVRPRSISSLYWNRAWLRRPVTVSGVGVALEEEPPRADVLERLRNFFGHPSVRSVSARDTASAAWIRQHLGPSVPVRVTADLAFAASLPPALPRRLQTLGVVLRKQPSEEDVAAVLRIRHWAHELGFTTEFLVLATGATREEETAALRTAFGPAAVIRTAGTVRELAAAVSGYGAVFTAKFHGAVVAYRYGVPPLSLRRTHKIEALAGALGDPALVAWAEAPDDALLLRRAQRRLPAEAVAGMEASAQEEVASVVASLAAATSTGSSTPLHGRKQTR